MKLYFAYGANTNHPAMAVRCPDARYVCNITLRGHRLVFRGVADVVPARRQKVVGAVWLISAADEAALDRFEGFPRLYVKRYVTLQVAGKRHRVMFYVMRSRSYEAAPSSSYEQCLREGYKECGMPTAQIDRAIRTARKWYERHGAKVAEVRHGSWAPPALKATPEELFTDSEDEEAAEQFLYSWYNQEGDTK